MSEKDDRRQTTEDSKSKTEHGWKSKNPPFSYVKLRSKPAAKTDLSRPWVLAVGGPRSVVAGIGSLLATRTRQSASL
ncbi:MAG: hypothetical protein K9L59_19585, partial [Desulfobacterales bacterium]|nr:hypothetical protein [Desulfobacterales bacterium]